MREQRSDLSSLSTSHLNSLGLAPSAVGVPPTDPDADFPSY